MNPAVEDDESLAERMREVRARGHLDAYELKLGVDRLSDWREHVRSHPLPAVAIGAVAGFQTARAVFPGPQPTKKVSRKAKKNADDIDENEVAAKAGAASAVTAIVGTMLTNAAKQYLTYQLQSRFRGPKP